MTDTTQFEKYDINESIITSPISENDIAGSYLKYTDEYDQINEAMKEDNPRLKLGIWEKPLKKADWEKVKMLSSDLLHEKSKDLQVASWLSLALLKLHGFEGLALGLSVILELSNRFWDTIHPLPDGEDYDTRLSPFYWIDEKLYIHLKLIPITSHPIDGIIYTYEKWEADNIKLKHSEESFNPVDKYLEYVELSDENFHLELDKYTTESSDTIEKLKELLRSKNLTEFPHFVTLEKTLDDIKVLNKFALSEFEKTRHIEEIETPSETEEVTDDTDTIHGSKLPEKISDVETAYKLISRAANYLIQKHPEHPSGHIAQMAIDFRNKTLKQSLAYNIKDETKLEKMFDILNI